MNTSPLHRGAPSLAAATFLVLCAAGLASVPARSLAHDSYVSVNGAVHVEGSEPAGNLSTVNGSIQVDAGLHADKVSTVNGSIHIDSGASIGEASTVNGGITLETHASAQSLGTVNGAINLGAGAHVTGAVASVNGRLNLAEGVDIAGDLSNVNGGIHLSNAHIAGSVKTHNGDIYVGSGSHIDGGIEVLRSRQGGDWFGWFWTSSHQRTPKVVIGPGAVVMGTLHFERPVELRVSNQARVGRIEGATPVKF